MLIDQDQVDEYDVLLGELENDSNLGGEDETDNNISPKHTPASQIAVLNVKSRLHHYNFVTNKNEEKFNASISQVSQAIEE